MAGFAVTIEEEKEPTPLSNQPIDPSCHVLA
jgi:hypothetical protein